MGEPGSNMSCVESITYAGSIEDLQDLSTDQIKLFEHYKFKDPSDISNSLAIYNHKKNVIYIYIKKKPIKENKKKFQISINIHQSILKLILSS
jgi:hypothetical protein